MFVVGLISALIGFFIVVHFDGFPNEGIGKPTSPMNWAAIGLVGGGAILMVLSIITLLWRKMP